MRQGVGQSLAPVQRAQPAPEQGAAGVDGKDGITRVIYQDKDGKNKHTIATLDDGLKFKGDDSTVITKKLDEQLDITGGADSKNLTDKNIAVQSTDDGKLKVQMAKNLTDLTSVTTGNTTIDNSGLTIKNDDNVLRLTFFQSNQESALIDKIHHHGL